MISLIIATYNGAPTLARTLEAMTHLEAPDAGHEIIVVDNASTDDTPAIIERFRDRLPLTHLHEARRGKGHALNTAMEAAQGDFLVFTDDDVIPDPVWLRAYEAAAKAHPDYGFFIGQIRHDWARTPPHWLERLAAAGLSYAGTPEDMPEGPASLFVVKGPNMAIRRATLGDVCHRTDAATNYMGTGTGTGGEDSWFARDASGGRIWYIPDALVRHMVRDHEIGVRPVFRRYVRIGLTNYHTSPNARALFDRRVLNVPIRVHYRLARYVTGSLYRLVRGDTESAARRMIDFAMDLGRMKSWRAVQKKMR